MTWPTQSNGAGRRGERARPASRTSATAPMGRLMKKMARQLSSIRNPPTTGPAAEATPAPRDQRAIARARSASSAYASRINASDDGMITAAPAPCASRAATSTASEGASPHATEAITNSAKPDPNARRAPMRSASAPADSSSAANMSV